MIVYGEDKAKQVYEDGDRIFLIYMGYDLVYNCYAIPQDEIIFIQNCVADQHIKANTEWSLSGIADDFYLDESVLDEDYIGCEAFCLDSSTLNSQDELE